MKKNTNSKEPHYLEHRTRLRNRFVEGGIDVLNDYEIVELFLTFVIPHKDVKESAKQAQEKFKTIRGLFDATDKELCEIPYFKGKALTLRKFIKEVALLYQRQQVEQIPVNLSKDKLLTYCKSKLGFNKEEEFWVISLDSKYSFINVDRISKGLTNKAPVYPKQVIETALKNGASSICLLHKIRMEILNHLNKTLQ